MGHCTVCLLKQTVHCPAKMDFLRVLVHSKTLPCLRPCFQFKIIWKKTASTRSNITAINNFALFFLFSQNKLDAKTFEAQILHDVACEWLNQNDTMYKQQRKNYEKWRPSDKKRLLNLASFFPLTGEKYTAVELLPGM